MATYNWESAPFSGPVAFDRQFEVASHHWIDQTDESGSMGRDDSYRCQERL
jgi:alpha-mannosidase